MTTDRFSFVIGPDFEFFFGLSGRGERDQEHRGKNSLPGSHRDQIAEGRRLRHIRPNPRSSGQSQKGQALHPDFQRESAGRHALGLDSEIK